MESSELCPFLDAELDSVLETASQNKRLQGSLRCSSGSPGEASSSGGLATSRASAHRLPVIGRAWLRSGWRVLHRRAGNFPRRFASPCFSSLRPGIGFLLESCCCCCRGGWGWLVVINHCYWVILTAREAKFHFLRSWHHIYLSFSLIFHKRKSLYARSRTVILTYCLVSHCKLLSFRPAAFPAFDIHSHQMT